MTPQHQHKRLARWADILARHGATRLAERLREVLRRAEFAVWPREADNGDPDITCELCADESWWQQNFGSGWEWARWWYCGPFGLDCPNIPEPPPE